MNLPKEGSSFFRYKAGGLSIMPKVKIHVSGHVRPQKKKNVKVHGYTRTITVKK